MRRSTLLCLTLTLTMLVSFASGALAFGPGDRHEDNGPGYENGVGHTSHGNGKGLGHHKDGDTEIPELDPNAAGGALILLVGGTLLLLERRR